MTQSLFNLLAIVAVEPAHRVRCQQPHCGHSIYARIHIVEEAGELLVLGSDCFAKRYGVASTTNFSGFGGGGGRTLTDAEREMLLNNTAALLAKFEEERVHESARIELANAQAAANLKALRQFQVEQQKQHVSMVPPSHRNSWQREAMSAEPTTQNAIQLPAWATLKKLNSSYFAYGMEDGQCWVLMQSSSHEGCFIAPVPMPFDAWDEALPLSIGKADLARNVYVSQSNINTLTSWFSSRCRKGSRIDSDASAIQKFAENVAG